MPARTLRATADFASVLVFGDLRGVQAAKGRAECEAWRIGNWALTLICDLRPHMCPVQAVLKHERPAVSPLSNMGVACRGRRGHGHADCCRRILVAHACHRRCARAQAHLQLMLLL